MMLGKTDFKDTDEMVQFLNEYSENIEDETIKDKFSQISMYIKVVSYCMEKDNERHKQNKAINGKAHRVMAKRT